LEEFLPHSKYYLAKAVKNLSIDLNVLAIYKGISYFKATFRLKYVPN